MRKYLSEGIGAFILVFFGTLAAVTSQGNVVVTALVFGVTFAALFVLLQPVSQGHFNPAISFGAWLQGGLPTSDIVPYWIAQFLGAIGGSMLLLLIVGSGSSLGETTFATLSPDEALRLEVALTFLVVCVVVSVGARQGGFLPALLVGGAFFLASLVALPLTGAGLNPARSIAPVVVGADPLAASQLWVYILGPFVGGAGAGMLARTVRRRTQ